MSTLRSRLESYRGNMSQRAKATRNRLEQESNKNLSTSIADAGAAGKAIGDLFGGGDDTPKPEIKAENLNLSETDVGGDFKEGLANVDHTSNEAGPGNKIEDLALEKLRKRKKLSGANSNFIEGAMSRFDEQQASGDTATRPSFLDPVLSKFGKYK